jgi:hypothetical protein
VRTAALALLFACSTLLSNSARAADWIEWHWGSLDQPCAGDCAAMVFAGSQVNTHLQPIVFKAIPPWRWDVGDGGFVGTTVSRRMATLFHFVDLEPEIGFGKRFGDMDEAEVWAALYVRFTDFPWNHIVYTTMAVATGLNYASGISDWERQTSVRGGGSPNHLMHYFSPEITFASPKRKDLELVIRMHHRSGLYGVLNNAGSGAQYITAGVRWRF